MTFYFPRNVNLMSLLQFMTTYECHHPGSLSLLIASKCRNNRVIPNWILKDQRAEQVLWPNKSMLSLYAKNECIMLWIWNPTHLAGLVFPESKNVVTLTNWNNNSFFKLDKQHVKAELLTKQLREWRSRYLLWKVWLLDSSPLLSHCKMLMQIWDCQVTKYSWSVGKELWEKNAQLPGQLEDNCLVYNL